MPFAVSMKLASYELENICIVFETTTQTEDLKRVEESTLKNLSSFFFTAFFDLNVTTGFVFYLLCYSVIPQGNSVD